MDKEADPVTMIDEALEVLGLPSLITREDIRKQYRFLVKKHHPDIGGDPLAMERINRAYRVLMEYIEAFRYSFDEEEVNRQFPGEDHARRFRP